MPPLVSVVTCACNQGNWVRETIPRIRESLGDWPHEIIVVDDQSIDGCCHDLDQDTLVLRTDTRYGVSASRRLACRVAKGGILLFTDPHCHYPDNALRSVVQDAVDKQAIVVAKTTSRPKVSRARHGGFLTESDRGLKVSYALRRPADWPALLGTIYAMQRPIYDHLGGWPELPGVWGYSEQALSLMAWFSGVIIHVNQGPVCNHEHYHPKEGTRFSYKVPLSHQAQNGHWVHAGYFPKTYESKWLPILKKRFRDKPEHLACLGVKGFESRDPGVKRRTITNFRAEVLSRAVYTEEDFYELVLGTKEPVNVVEPDESYVEQQRARSKPTSKYDTMHFRQDRALLWLIQNVPGCMGGKKVLDLGSRTGYVVDQIKKLRAGKVEGVELVPETAEYARDVLGRNVITGDARSLPYKDGEWNVATFIHTLEHIPNPEAAIQEMMRVLSPGGWFMIAVPKEEKPSRGSAHNCCFKDEAALSDLVNKFPVEKVITETLQLTDRTDKVLFEIYLAGRKPSNRPIPTPVAQPIESLIEQQRERTKAGDDYRRWYWRQERALEWMLEHAPNSIKGKSIVDVGARDGHTLQVLVNHGATPVHGIELIPEMAADAVKRTGLPVLACDMRDMPFGDSSKDGVTCIHTLEHIPNPEEGIREMLRILRPGGYLLINVPRERKLNVAAGHNCRFRFEKDLTGFVKKFPVTDIVIETVPVLPGKKGEDRGSRELLLLCRKS